MIGTFNGPVVAVVAFALAVQSLDVQYLGAEPLQYNADVLDAEVPFLVDAQLIDQQQELLGGDGLVLHHGVLRFTFGALVLGLPAVSAATFNV